MTFRMILLSAAASGLLVLTAAAQTETAPATTTEAPAATAPETPAPAAETPPPIPAKPNETDKAYPIPAEEQPREVLKGKFDDWEVRCNAKDETRCFLYQLAKAPDGRPIAEVTMIRLPDGGQAAAGATVVTSLGVLLPRGLTLVIDNGQPLGYPFYNCLPPGCFARLGLTAPTLTRLKKGATAKIVIYAPNAPDKPVEGSISLKGFTAAFDSLTPVQAP